MGGALALQAQGFLAAAVFGVFLAVVYDSLRVVRLLAHPGKLPVFLMDALYMVFAAFVTYSAALGLSRGEVRLYLILGEAVGFAAYLLTLGRITTGLARLVYNGALRFIVTPLRRVRARIRVVFLGLRKKLCISRKKPLKSPRKMVYNQRSVRANRSMPKGVRRHEGTEK